MIITDGPDGEPSIAASVAVSQGEGSVMLLPGLALPEDGFEAFNHVGERDQAAGEFLT